MSITFLYKNNKITFFCDDFAVGEILPYKHECAESTDKVTLVENGAFEWTRRVRLSAAENTVHQRVVMDFLAYHHPVFRMIPAVSYNGNIWGEGNEPKGFEKDGEPWSFGSSRTSVPGATYSEGKDYSVALFGKTGPCISGLSCSFINSDTGIIHRIIWPEEEKPYVYDKRDGYGEAYNSPDSLHPGDTIEIKAYIVIERVNSKAINWRRFLDFAWKLNYHDPVSWYCPKRIWNLGIKYAKEYLWVEDRLYRGFSKGLVWNNRQWMLRSYDKYFAGWTGQNISLANSMLYDYLKNGDTSSLEKGLKTLDTWSDLPVLSNGLMRCCYDYILGDKDPETEVQDSCNLGQAAVGFFEAFELAEKCGFKKPQYKKVALGICRFAVHNQEKNGQLAKSWYNDGRCFEKDGTTGSFLIVPLISAYRHTNDAAFLNAAEKAYRFYAGELIDKKYSTAGALDTWCIDKESAYPLLEGGIKLYEATGNMDYLKYAEAAAYYLATWQWHHSVEFPQGSPLDMMKYDSFGGTSVSIQHHHMDPYAVIFVNSWYKLAEYTGNELWKQRARAAWKNGIMGISDGSLKVMGKIRPEGSQDEGFLHTRWGIIDEEGELRTYGHVTQWLVAWPTAFRLQTLRTFTKWNELS